MSALRRLFRDHPVVGAAFVGVIAGPLIAVGYNDVTLWWVTRNNHPMLLTTGPSYLSVLAFGAAGGLFLGAVGGFLYKHYARKS